MSCKFSCFLSLTDAQRERDIGIFHSDNGDVYKVTYKSNVCRDLLLTIEWTFPKQILFTVKLYSTSFKRCLCSKGMVINGKKAFMKLRGAFNVSNSRDYKVLCVVSLIPYIRFNDTNETLPELINDSGFGESELEQSSLDENNAVTYEEINSGNEIVDEDRDVRNTSIVNVTEINVPKEHENSQSVNEMVHASCSNSVLEFGKNAQRDEMMIEESTVANSTRVLSNNTDMSVLLMNQDSLNSSEVSDKTTKNDNVWKSILQEHDYENRENDLEDNFTEIVRDSLNGNSDNKDHEFKLSDDKSTEENTVIRKSRKSSILITKRLTLDDYSEEITENIKTINIHNVEPTEKFSESNSSMDVDLPELMFKIPTAPRTEDSSLSCSNKNAREKFSPNISREINQKEDTEFPASSENGETGCSANVADLDSSSDSTKTRFVLESNNVPMNKFNYDDKQLEIVSKCHFQSSVQDSNTSEIQNDNPLIVDSNSSPLSMHSSSKLKITGKNNALMDSHNSELQNLSPSKTNLIFHTLVRKLSAGDYDPQLKDVEKSVAKSSGKSVQNLLGSESDNSMIFPIIESQLKGLSLDMLDLLITGEMVDAEITNGEKHIKVHRAIVSARSSGLRKLFVRQRIFSAVEANYIAVVDIPSNILEDVVIFLYVGVIHIESTEMLQKLYRVAEMYCISDLIDICAKHI